MRRFLPILLALSALGCQSLGGRKTASGWYVLEKAADVKCGRWPLREKDLQVEELMVVKAARQPGFLVSGLKRDASPMHYYSAFKGDIRADQDQFVNLSLGRNAVIVGGETVGGGMLANIVHNTTDKATLEVRTVKDNLVTYRAELGRFNVVEGETVQAQGGAFIAYKTEDNTYHLAFVDLKSKKPTHKVVAGVTFKDKPIILASPAKPGAVVVFKDGESGKVFRLQTVAEDGTAGTAMPLDIDAQSQVESWAAAQFGGGIYLAYVDGDSMIGQADLKISYVNSVDGATTVKWTKASPLKDVHVTEPVFLASGKGLEVLLLNWIDEESTIARYMVAGGTVGKPAYSGIYPKGARIVDAFTGESPDDLYVVTRHRDDTRWAFNICEI